MTMFKPAEIRDHRVHAVAMDFDKTLQWHAYCPDTRAAHFSEHVSVLVAVFFLRSRSVVLDCGHTPGQHAQWHNTPTIHI